MKQEGLATAKASSEAEVEKILGEAAVQQA